MYRKILFWFALSAGLLLLYVSGDATARAISGPALITIFVGVAFLAITLRGGKYLPLNDIGVWYVGTLGAYTVLPLLTFLALAKFGVQWSPLNDARILDIQPTTEEIARIGWYYVTYLVAFVAVYSLRRGSAAIVHGTGFRLRPSFLYVMFGLWIVAKFALFGIDFLFNVGGGSTYGDTYRVLWQLPLPVRQLFKFSTTMQLVLNILILVWLFTDYKKFKWWILGWLTLELVQTTIVLGARTNLMLLFGAAGILYCHFVKPVRATTAIVVGMLGLMLFLVIGAFRAFQGATGGEAHFGGGSGEFEALFVNGLDLQKRKDFGTLPQLDANFYFSDLTAPIPSQLLPVRKVDMSEWYVKKFYPWVKDAGGGYTFGVIPQSIVGFGFWEIVARGAFVGFLFGTLHRYFRRRPSSLWPITTYVWMILMSYQSFRVNTLFAITPFLQGLVPTLVITYVGSRMLEYAVSRKSTPSPQLAS